MSSLAFLAIDESLRGLIEAREELFEQIYYGPALEKGATADQIIERQREIVERQNELVEVERLLVDYATKYVGKVDSMYYYLQVSEIEVAAAKKEAKRFEIRARRIESGRERLKSILLRVMTEQNKTRIDGTAGRYLGRQPNGGLAPLIVDGWDDAAGKWTVTDPVLTEDYIDVTVKLPLTLWAKLFGMATELCRTFAEVKATTPANGRIREALADVCGICDGQGALPNADGSATVGCNLCGGSGKRIVPGARLGERGQQLRLR